MGQQEIPMTTLQSYECRTRRKASSVKSKYIIHPCHTAAILSRETKRALFYHVKPRNGNHGDEVQRGKTKLFWSLRDNMCRSFLKYHSSEIVLIVFGVVHFRVVHLISPLG